MISTTSSAHLISTIEGFEEGLVTVPADTTQQVKLYVVAPSASEASQAERTDLRIWIEDVKSGDSAYKDTVFNGRAN
jgi:hypothetical protein